MLKFGIVTRKRDYKDLLIVEFAEDLRNKVAQVSKTLFCLSAGWPLNGSSKLIFTCCTLVQELFFLIVSSTTI